MKEFFSLSEILDAKCPALPGSLRALSRLAREGRWQNAAGKARKRNSVGGGYEYHISLLPASTQTRLAVIHSSPANEDKSASHALWRAFEALSKAQKKTCNKRLAVIQAVEAYRESGLAETAAVVLAATEAGVSGSSIFNWQARLNGVDRSDWLPALAPEYKSTAKRADCPEEAWAALKSDFLRPEKPGFSACYRRVAHAAKAKGWDTLPSERALRRRLNAEVSRSVQVLARDGKDKAKALYPAQRRTRTHLHAMQAVNMDGHKFDVFVKLANSKVTRLHLIALQDLYSGKIVAWRLSDSENKETVRLVIGDMVERHGIPEKIYLDNGRAFASKWISGGTANRFRFKVRDEDPRGLLTTLGVAISWTTPYSGQSKPIERAFRDLTDDIARHPLCAGAYTGNKPDAKPENYGSKAVPIDTFQAHVAREIEEHNARPGRRSQVCAGRSFDTAFEASLSKDTTLVKWPTRAQCSLWLLAAEQIRAQKGSGEIHLFGNRYWAAELNGHRGKKVTVRFDPDHLTRDLKIYDLSDRFVCDAPCIEDAGFDDITAAREHARRRGAFAKAVAEQKRIHAEMSAEELADLYAAGGKTAEKSEPKPSRKVVRLATGGPAAKEPVWDEEATDFFGNAMAAVSGADVIEFGPLEVEETEPVCIGYGSKKDGGQSARRK